MLITAPIEETFLMFRKKDKDSPRQPREVIISRSPLKKTLKWFFLIVFLIALGIGAWILVTADQALKKITINGNNKSSIFSFFGEGSLKGQSEGRTNILILGLGGKGHPGGMLTDTLIVASLDYDEKRIGLISTPRDLWVPIEGFNHAKINQAHSYGEQNKDSTGGGGELASKTIENVLGIPIHYYFVLDFDGFKEIVDMVGGVDIYVEKDINDPYYPADDMINYSPFKISAGMQHLDGDRALKYVRSRETTSDFDRSRRQEQVMSALKDKLVSLNILANPKKITDLINILGEHLRTSMQIDEIMACWNVVKTLDTANIINKVLDTAADGPLTAAQDYRGYYIYPRKGIDKFQDLHVIAENLFDGEGVDEDATFVSAKVEILNGTNQAGLALAVSQLLSSYGYNVVSINDATGDYPNSVIYDFSDGKHQKTAQGIGHKINATVSNRSSTREGVDIQVVIGEDYLE